MRGTDTRSLCAEKDGYQAGPFSAWRSKVDEVLSECGDLVHSENAIPIKPGAYEKKVDEIPPPQGDLVHQMP